jgi:succinoglycan biosynthesis transport protein ExoP
VSLKPPNKQNFDSQEFISRVLGLSRYHRLAVLLCSLSILAGIVYYVYSDALYYSKSLVNVQVYSYAVDAEAGDPGRQSIARSKRNLKYEFANKQMLKRIATRMGLVNQEISADLIKELYIPKYIAALENNDQYSIEVYATKPEIVRQFTPTLIEEFTAHKKELHALSREKKIASYKAERNAIDDKRDALLISKAQFEKKNSYADVEILHARLSQVPVNLDWTRARLQQAEDVRALLAKPDSKPELLINLTELTSFYTEQPIEIGSLRRNSESRKTAPLAIDQQVATNIKPLPSTKINAWQELAKQRRVNEEKIRDALNSGVGPKNSLVTNLESNIKELTSKLNIELEHLEQQFELDCASLAERKKTLESRLTEYYEITRKWAKLKQDYEALDKGELEWGTQRKQLSARIASLEFGAEKERFELIFGGHTVMRDKIPVSPNKAKLLIISLILGVAMGIGMPTLLQLFDSSASRLQQIETATGMIGLGIVPLMEKSDLENLSRSPTLSAQIPNQLLENFRIIRSNIVLHPNAKGHTQTIMVTSAKPTEGKTTQAANIAWSFTSLGEKTLLVDADLRRGRIHELTKTNNAAGLTTLLTGGARPDQLIQRTNLENLHVIPRGPVIPGSTEVLSQIFFADLIAEWASQYDRIIIDTPPVLGLSETTSIQRVTDGVILVVRAEKTPQKDVVDAVELLKKAGAHFFGFVLNGIDLSKKANYYQFNYYSPDYYAALDDADELLDPSHQKADYLIPTVNVRPPAATEHLDSKNLQPPPVTDDNLHSQFHPRPARHPKSRMNS